MNLPSEAFLRQREIQARCFHPTGEWTEFTTDEIQQSIPARFAAIVARFADRIAIKSLQHELTYAQLNRAANAVAQQLLRVLPKGPQPIVLYCQHGVPALVAVLGVLKTGKFYVCLDPQSPTLFNHQLLDELEPACLLTDQATHALAEQLAKPGMPLYNIEQLDWQAETAIDPTCIIAPTDLAYVTFTSGSTGRPKGVMEEHQDVLHYTRLFNNYFHFCPEDRILTVTRISASGAWVSIYPALLNGAQLYLYDVLEIGTAALAQLIAKSAITATAMAASVFRELAPYLPPKEALPHFRLLGLGGETILSSDIARYQASCPDHCLLRFAFGCTEAHFISCYFMDKATPLPTGPTPVGYPTEDAEIFLLDEQGNEVPAGEVGELVVKRTYLTRGYWQNPALTAARYQCDPQQPAKRLYRLGDLGRKTADGCLTHVGRKDNLVKIRGQFVDLDDLERRLVQLVDVDQAVAVLDQEEPGTPYLVAYLKVKPGTQATITRFYQQLANALPAAMLPRSLVLLDHFPLTLSGKIDRRALPKPNTQRPALVTPYRPPQPGLEERLVALWQEILQIVPIGVDDTFLELGGDSLRAMMVINRLYSLSASFVHVRHFFEAPTIAAFSHFLERHYPEAVQQLIGPEHATSLASTSGQRQGRQRLDPPTIQQIRTWLSVFQRQNSAAPVSNPVPLGKNPSSKNPSAIFVLSAPRSGSTLFRVLLGGHPQLFAPPELSLLYFKTLQERYAALAGAGAGEHESALRAIMAAKNCDGETAQALMQQMEAENLTTQAFYRQLQAWMFPRRLVEKTPGYAYNLETLQQAEAEFDEPRYIHLVRHPLGMIHSYVEDKTALRLLARLRHQSPILGLPALTEELPFTPAIIAEAIWLIVQQTINAFFATIPPQRRLLLCFEELVRQPTVELARVCTFLGIPFHPAMLQPYGDPSTRMTDGINALNLMAGDAKFSQYKQIDPTIAERWREQSTTDFLSDQTWAVAETLGYKRSDLPGREHSLATPPSLLSDLTQLVSQLEAFSEAEATALLQQTSQQTA